MTQVFPGTLNVGLGMGYLHMDKEMRGFSALFSGFI